MICLVNFVFTNWLHPTYISPKYAIFSQNSPNISVITAALELILSNYFKLFVKPLSMLCQDSSASSSSFKISRPGRVRASAVLGPPPRRGHLAAPVKIYNSGIHRQIRWMDGWPQPAGHAVAACHQRPKREWKGGIPASFSKSGRILSGSSIMKILMSKKWKDRLRDPAL